MDAPVQLHGVSVRLGAVQPSTRSWHLYATRSPAWPELCLPPRAGYVIVNALVRLHGLSVARSIKRFTAAREPGIYKPAYINDLFKSVHVS